MQEVLIRLPWRGGKGVLFGADVWCLFLVEEFDGPRAADGKRA